MLDYFIVNTDPFKNKAIFFFMARVLFSPIKARLRPTAVLKFRKCLVSCRALSHHQQVLDKASLLLDSQWLKQPPVALRWTSIHPAKTQSLRREKVCKLF